MAEEPTARRGARRANLHIFPNSYINERRSERLEQTAQGDNGDEE
jgi:hypothetical protein